MVELNLTGPERRRRIRDARLMLIFTPELCQDPLRTLSDVWGFVDVVQIRPKQLGSESQRPSKAQEVFDWAKKVLAIATSQPGRRPLLVVNDRVDVAVALAAQGIDGVHLGQEDTPVQEARSELGPDHLIGLSTHSFREVRECQELPVDYLGFGAVFPTATKSSTTPNHSVQSWIAHGFFQKPVFPIGGITADNAWLLKPIGRAAVGSGILSSATPHASAVAIRTALQSYHRGERRDMDTRH